MAGVFSFTFRKYHHDHLGHHPRVLGTHSFSMFVAGLNTLLDVCSITCFGGALYTASALMNAHTGSNTTCFNKIGKYTGTALLNPRHYTEKYDDQGPEMDPKISQQQCSKELCACFPLTAPEKCSLLCSPIFKPYSPQQQHTCSLVPTVLSHSSMNSIVCVIQFRGSHKPFLDRNTSLHRSNYRTVAGTPVMSTSVTTTER